jgi:hypothetical protein
VNQVVSKWFCKKPQTAVSKRGAYLLNPQLRHVLLAYGPCSSVLCSGGHSVSVRRRKALLFSPNMVQYRCDPGVLCCGALRVQSQRLRAGTPEGWRFSFRRARSPAHHARRGASGRGVPRSNAALALW